MGLFRRKDERAIPKPGSKEFEEAVRGTAPPPEESSSADEPLTGEPAPDEPVSAEPAAETSPAEETDEPDQPAGDADEQTRRKKVLGSLGRSILKPPNADGFGGGVSGAPPKRKPKD